MAQEATLEQSLMEAMHAALVNYLLAGKWITLEYGGAPKITADQLRALYAQIDMCRVMSLVVRRVEDGLADRVFNALATELATDVKHVLSNGELRAEVRTILGERIRAAESALLER